MPGARREPVINGTRSCHAVDCRRVARLLPAGRAQGPLCGPESHHRGCLHLRNGECTLEATLAVFTLTSYLLFILL